MDFSLTDDQRMIRDAAESFLGEATGDVWPRIGSELGWCGIPIAEAHGGLGLGPVELVLVQEQAGRRLLSAPFFSSVCLSATLLNEAGSDAAKQEYLPGIAQGSLRASAPLDHWQAPALSGVRAQVPDGADAEVWFVPTRAGLYAVERQALQVTSPASWDESRRFASASLDGAKGERIDDPHRQDGLARTLALVRLYIAAEQLGGAQQCLDSTVASLGTRKQFGRALASFQALKHRCAEMMVAVEATRSMVYGAAAVAAGRGPTDALALECAAAKALASETYFFCAQETIQLHGGVGFTWEFDAHRHFKRAQASSHWLGSADALHESIAASAFGKAA